MPLHLASLPCILLLLAITLTACGSSGGSSGGSPRSGSSPADPSAPDPSPAEPPPSEGPSPGDEFPLWSVLEIDLTAARVHKNPYTDVDVEATFRGPDGETMEVNGFWDGGRHFRVRFTPVQKGDWTYAIESSPADAGLTLKGSFSVGDPLPGSRGFLRRDPEHSYSFIHDDGTRPFLWGQTYYEIVRNARANGPWRQAIDGTKAHGMNKVRLLVNPGWDTPTRPYPRSSPFEDDDHNRLDIDHWRALDEVVDHLLDRDMIADLILFVDHERGFGTEAQDHRFVRQVLARYAAYPNVIWCLTNEWNYTQKSAEYWNRIGRMVRAEDPWIGEGQRLRLLSIHQETRHGFQFFRVDWPVHAIVQVGVRNHTPQFRNGDEWGNHGIKTNRNRGMPVINDEYGYIAEDDKSEPQKEGSYPAFSRPKHRHVIWGIAIAGGHGSAGDAHEPGGNSVFFTSNWHDRPEYDDIQRLVEFWTKRGIEHWKMPGRNDLITSGKRAYARAIEGQEYVVYTAVGGTVEIDLARGRYDVFLFDPRSGEVSALPTATGGGSRSFEVPTGGDWVLHLKKK